MTDEIKGPVTITPEMQGEMKAQVDAVNQQKIADDCMIEVMAVFTKYDCQPVFEAILSSEGPIMWKLTARNRVKNGGGELNGTK